MMAIVYSGVRDLFPQLTAFYALCTEFAGILLHTFTKKMWYNNRT